MIRVLDANQIQTWTNKVFSAITYVQKCRGITRPQSFLIWSEWKEQFFVQKKYEFQQSTFLRECEEKLFTLLREKRVVRVLGHKGIGKTRLILEAFNPNFSSIGRALSGSVVYVDLANVDPTLLSTFINSHKELEGILIVDNCNDTWHNALLAPISSGGNLRLITIFDSIDTFDQNAVVIDRSNQREAVKMIFKNCFGSLSDAEVEHFLKISEGFPEMVPFIEDAINNKGTASVFQTIPEDFIKNFLFGSAFDSDEYQLFKACSIFKTFLFYDDKVEDILRDEEKALAKLQSEVIRTKLLDSPISENLFYSFCTKFRDKRKLIEKYGLYHSIIPEPIAVNLAADWWDGKPFSFIGSILEDLQKAELLVPLCDRLKLLDQSERAKLLVEKLWGMYGPFSQAEVLNTELGSRLFRSVVEVNPEATSEALDQTFGEANIESLRRFREGRRNIVWALEKLAFRRSTFDVSAKMLARLAAGENEERIGNNATAQFLQLFHIFLPGTEASLEQRIKILEWLFLQNADEFKKLTVNALGRCLKGEGFHRMGGAEIQGSRGSLDDYIPTNVEIADYWRFAVHRLTHIALRDKDAMRNLAMNIIASNIRSMFYHGSGKLIADAVIAVTAGRKMGWPEALEGALNAKRFDRQRLKEDDKYLLDELIELLRPKDMQHRLTITVSKPILDFSYQDGHNNYHEISRVSIEKIAKEFADDYSSNKKLLSIVLEGEQRFGFEFGAALVAHVKDPQQLLDDLFEALLTIAHDRQNTNVVSGVLSRLDPEVRSNFIYEIIRHQSLYRQSFSIVRYSGASIEDIFKLFELIDEQRAEIGNFTAFQYGRALDSLGTPSLLRLCDRIKQYGVKGERIALQLLLQYCHSFEDNWQVCKDHIRLIILKNNMLDDEDGFGLDHYLLTVTIERLLKEHPEDQNLAETISKHIFELSQSERLGTLDTYVGNLCLFLVNHHFSDFWSQIATAFEHGGLAYFNLKFLLGAKNGDWGHPGILFSGDEESRNMIFDWCIKHRPDGPKRIAYMMPLLTSENNKVAWHPFAERMIDEFGDVEGFLNELSANMGTFGSTNFSSIEYYQELKIMVTELKNHAKSEVRAWAKQQIKYYEQAIKRDQLDSEQWFIR